MNTSHSQGIIASAFIYEDGKVFVAKRADTKSFLPGSWEIPGGHVEFGESVEEALIREVREELGIAITVTDPFFVFSYLPNENRHMIEVDCFAYRTNPEQEIRLNAEDHSAMAWITEDEIDDYFGNNDAVNQGLKKGFQLLKDF